MPAGTCPPNPWEDPKLFIVWYHDRVAELLDAGMIEELKAFTDEQQETIERLRLEPPESE
jgi:hypothetical protein